METNDTRVWGIHTMDDHLFLNNNLIAIGWHEMGDISDIQNSREALKQKYPIVYPDKKPGAAPTDCGQIFRFINANEWIIIGVFNSKALLYSPFSYAVIISFAVLPKFL